VQTGLKSSILLAFWPYSLKVGKVYFFVQNKLESLFFCSKQVGLSKTSWKSLFFFCSKQVGLSKTS
jgi:hypothetical protein